MTEGTLGSGETSVAPRTGERATIEATYMARTPASAGLATRARRCMPGGNTRTFGFLRPYPPVFDRAEGPFMWDVDGNRYVDLVGNGYSLIHGHAYPSVVQAVQVQVARGTAWPGTSAPQMELADPAMRETSGAKISLQINPDRAETWHRANARRDRGIGPSESPPARENSGCRTRR